MHGVVFSWESSDEQIARVASDGNVFALRSGHCFVTGKVGNKRAKVKVEVRDGVRPRLSNAQWDIEHANDCKDPERDAEDNKDDDKQTGAGSFTPQSLPAPDPDDPINTPEAPARNNAVGHPRFSPDLVAASTDDQLGSSNFNLTIPIFGSGGRGMGAGVSLAYNGRMWTKDGTEIIYDYDQGWPAPGFRLN